MAELLRLKATGLNARQIAEQLGVSRNAVLGRLDRIVRPDRKKKAYIAQNAERRAERLKKQADMRLRVAALWKTRLSDGAIGRELGISQRWVGQIRCSLKLPPHPPGTVRHLRYMRYMPPTPAVAATFGLEANVRDAVMALERGQCRWIEGDPLAGAIGFCQNPAAHGAWCQSHHAVVFQVGTGWDKQGRKSMVSLSDVVDRGRNGRLPRTVG